MASTDNSHSRSIELTLTREKWLTHNTAVYETRRLTITTGRLGCSDWLRVRVAVHRDSAFQ